MQIFITGIGTEVGKTIVSAIFTEALQADYFKALQSGNLDELDRDTVKNLISNEKDISSIQKIYSHTQSLSQCHQWLLKHAPGIELQSVSSNAEAVKIASKEKGAAAVASVRAAALFNVPLLAENIEDDPKNSTRFLVISNHEVKPSGLDKTSIIVAAKNQPGAIASMIEPFAKNKVSMTKLESRPSKTGLWEYVFFIDVEGHCQDEPVARSLDELDEICDEIRFLGSYPREVRA